jgi:hypothetical protein
VEPFLHLERIATFLAILFAVTALGGSFPPKYLVGNPREKYLVIAILICYLLAMGMAQYCSNTSNIPKATGGRTVFIAAVVAQ